MYCFRLLLPEISWPFALRFGTGSDSVEPLTLGAVPQMLVSITNCFMHIPATWRECWKEERNTSSSLLLETWVKDVSVAQITAVIGNTFH